MRNGKGTGRSSRASSRSSSHTADVTRSSRRCSSGSRCHRSSSTCAPNNRDERSEEGGREPCSRSSDIRDQRICADVRDRLEGDGPELFRCDGTGRGPQLQDGGWRCSAKAQHRVRLCTEAWSLNCPGFLPHPMSPLRQACAPCCRHYFL